jgi:hypothetical protein
MQALEGAAVVSSDVALNLSRASSTNPGLPPSSLFSFLRANRSIAGVYISEFDTCVVGVTVLMTQYAWIRLHQKTAGLKTRGI